MAVWLYAYARNGLGNYKQEDLNSYQNILDSIEVDELKIMADVKPAEIGFIRKHYTQHREKSEAYFRAMPQEEYLEYLSSIKMPAVSVDELVDHFIISEEKLQEERIAHYQDYIRQFQSGEAKSSWILVNHTDQFARFGNSLSGYWKSYGGLKVSIYNDVIWLSGPFEVFSSYYRFQHDLPRQSRECYHTLFSSIAKAFKSEFILYAHEWSLGDDDENVISTTELLSLMQKEISSYSIHDMDSFYFEFFRSEAL